MEIIPPSQYGLAWAILAFALIAVAVLFYVVLSVLTKKLKPATDVTEVASLADMRERQLLIKEKYSTQINEVGKLWENQKISTRVAFQTLSSCLRNFSHEYSYTGTYSMTLTDMVDRNAPQALSDRVKHYYPLAFEEAERNADVKLAVSDALKVVNLWT